MSLADRWSTYPSVGLTPTRLGEIFREADQGDLCRQMELFEEMEEKDAHLAAILQTRKLAVLGKDYEVLPYALTPEDERLAQAVGEMVYAIPGLEGALLDLLDAILPELFRAWALPFPRRSRIPPWTRSSSTLRWLIPWSRSTRSGWSNAWNIPGAGHLPL